MNYTPLTHSIHRHNQIPCTLYYRYTLALFYFESPFLLLVTSNTLCTKLSISFSNYLSSIV